MEVRIFLLADFANLDAGQKLNIIGAFNRIWARKFPAVHPSMYLVSKITAGLGEFGIERGYKILFFDEDANELGKLEGKFKFPTPHEGKYAEFNIILALRDIAFEKPGRYEFRLLVNENILGILPVDVVLRED